ncbi:metallophosphoesterase [Rhizobium sp. KVB221]|uniref:Metallophosphoesterase n=1 Tax=Rhizobium setariae TaxID=2801340 RepID=A0A937CRW4_9HYPH|nr:metallophosphoesterase [Rhizobium setariae]MBL0375382.1 metallophosphoesterase [Rhizobium setariae]
MGFVRKFYVADTHFSHNTIIGHCDRPFRHVGAMDEQMIRRWNAAVGESDLVYHLGDFAFELGNAERVRWIFERLHGQKFLIVGNHDVRRDGSLHPTIAGLAWAASPAQAMEIKDEGRRIYLAHYAHRVWPGQHHGGWHFYGHSHGKLPGFGRSRDVGVDLPDVDFTPRTFAELTAGMEA